MMNFSDPVELTARDEAEADATDELADADEDALTTEAIDVAELELGTSPLAMSMRQYPPAPSSSQIDCLSGVKRYSES